MRKYLGAWIFIVMIQATNFCHTHTVREMGLASILPAFSSSITSSGPLFPRRPFHRHLRRRRRHHHHGRLHHLSTTASPAFPASLQRKPNSNTWMPSLENATCRVSCCVVKAADDLDDEACELVSGVELSIGEGDDSISAYLYKAMKNNNGTGVLFLSDVFGFEDSSNRDFAYRVACNGYNVLVPDLFRGDPWEKNRPRTQFEQWRARQEPERVAEDIFTSAKWMVDEFVAAGISKKLGIIGFCFGGGKLVEVLAKDWGTCFGVGVSFYGTRIDPSVASNINVPVLFISGDKDSLCPVGVLKDLEKGIGRGSKVVIFEGRGHGFAHQPESAEDDRDAEKAFMLMRNWLHDGLIVNN